MNCSSAFAVFWENSLEVTGRCFHPFVWLQCIYFFHFSDAELEHCISGDGKRTEHLYWA